MKRSKISHRQIKIPTQQEQQKTLQYLQQLKTQGKTQSNQNKFPIDIVLNKSKRKLSYHQNLSKIQKNVRNQHLSRTMTSIKNIEPSIDNANKLGPLANIKALFKLKNMSQIQQDQKLKNPFYKIQKSRKFSNLQQKSCVSDKICFTNSRLAAKQTIASDFSTINNQSKKPSSQRQLVKQSIKVQLNKKHQVHIHKRQWYFASKRFKSKTQSNQPTNQRPQKMRSQLKISNKFSQQTQQQQQLNEKNSLLMKKPINDNFLEFNSADHLFPQQNFVIIEESREESPVKVRERSQTVTYYQIKDYFQRKYLKNSNPFDYK